MANNFSIIIHPISRELLYLYEPGMKRLSPDVANKILEWMSPFRASSVEGIKSYATGEKIEGELIMCPLLMEQMVSLSSRKVLGRVVRAVKLAKAHEADVIGLAAYTGMVGTRGSKIYDKLNAPVTTGAHTTLATIPEAILKAMNLLEYTPKKVKIFIFGANHMTHIILKTLGSFCGQFYLYHSLKDRVIDLYNSLVPEQRAKLKVISRDPRYILKDMDVIVNATSRVPTGFDEQYLKNGAIVFDSSYPRSITINRPDVLLIDGVVMEPPGKPRFNFNFGLPERYCFPCMAEPITLAFEKMYQSYSLGKDVSVEKAEKIYRLALKHGFTIGPLTAYEKIIVPERVREVRKNLKRRTTLFRVFK